MVEDGYIKFNCKLIEKKLSSDDLKYFKELNFWRNKLYDLKLIGAYPNKVGFGNISAKLDMNSFLITASTTGNHSRLGEEHYSKVVSFDLEKNELVCEGKMKASSESMTHGSVYTANKEINAVIHVHNEQMWTYFKDEFPCTSKDATYGTPEIAHEIARLFKETNVGELGLIVLGGHQPGLISFGKTLEEAGALMMKYFEEASNKNE